MAVDIQKYINGLSRNAGAKIESIIEAENQLGEQLPDDFKEFLMLCNGCEGFIGPDAYVSIWNTEQLVVLSQSYGIQKYVPGLLVFGTDGGEEAYGFDSRTPGLPVVRVPLVGMAWNLALPVAPSFVAFLEQLHSQHATPE